MRIVVRPAAAAEIDEAFRWYEEQRSGLGEELLGELTAVLEVLSSSPKRFRAVHRDARRALLKRFPYSVLYRVGATEVIVVAFFHGSRHPRSWRKRK